MTKESRTYIILKVCETAKLDLVDVFTSSGKVRCELIEYPLDRFVYSEFDVPIAAKKPMEFKFESIKVGQVLVTGNFELTLLIPCDRCLEDVEVPILITFNKELIKEELQDSDDADEFGVLDGTQFDVLMYVNQEILLKIPSKILCKEDCLGICPVCGCNRNEVKCECDTFIPDVRMAGIMDIFKGNKEV